MSHRIRWSACALWQLEDAIYHIATDNLMVARQLERRIRDCLDLLKDFPLSGRIVPELDDAERRVVIAPPFRIVYRVSNNEIRVLAVVHGRRSMPDAVPED